MTRRRKIILGLSIAAFVAVVGGLGGWIYARYFYVPSDLRTRYGAFIDEMPPGPIGGTPGGELAVRVARKIEGTHWVEGGPIEGAIVEMHRDYDEYTLLMLERNEPFQPPVFRGVTDEHGLLYLPAAYSTWDAAVLMVTADGYSSAFPRYNFATFAVPPIDGVRTERILLHRIESAACKVVDQRGRAVADARVGVFGFFEQDYFYDPDPSARMSALCRTDERGWFKFGVILPEEKACLVVIAPGYARRMAGPFLLKHAPRRIVLEPAVDGEVAGIVTSPDGEALENVKIELWPRGLAKLESWPEPRDDERAWLYRVHHYTHMYAAASDANGLVAFMDIPPGTWEWQALHKNGWAEPPSGEVVIDAESPGVLKFQVPPARDPHHW
ncbi:hypothetical protein KQI84_15280 [bacterium]|nr:hypothetical protein [bacterium]